MQVDAMFEEAEALQALPRAVYALLRSPLLSHHPKAHPDMRTHLGLLWASLPPEDLWIAVYPHLSSYQDPNTQVGCNWLQCNSHCYGQHFLVLAKMVMCTACTANWLCNQS